MSFDSESARLIDRIRASAFYQAKLAGGNFISIDWVAKKLRRPKRWVTRNWKKKPVLIKIRDGLGFFAIT